MLPLLLYSNKAMRYIKNPHTNPYYNMAFDEYCLESLPIDEPVFYLWQNRPSVIIGFNQDVNTEVNLDFLKSNHIDLVRRVTGGGAVYHDFGNLNYTIVGRSENLERDYPEYASLMMKALQELNVPAVLSGRNDILLEGKKVSGRAVGKGTQAKDWLGNWEHWEYWEHWDYCFFCAGVRDEMTIRQKLSLPALSQYS